MNVMGLFDKEGDIVVYTRNIHWHATGYLSGLKWRYKATARDQASGVTGSSRGWASGQGAVEEATRDMFQQLAAAGIFPPRVSTPTPTPTPTPTITIVEQPQQEEMTRMEESPITLLVSKFLTSSSLSSPLPSSLPSLSSLSSNGEDPFPFLLSSIAKFATLMDGFHNNLPTTTTSNSRKAIKNNIKSNQEIVGGIFDKSGDTVVYGRSLHWQASGYLKGLSWRYKATVTDKATGMSASVSGYKSGQGAVENATKELFQKLIAAGKITL
jgi:hypothetical protein